MPGISLLRPRQAPLCNSWNRPWPFTLRVRLAKSAADCFHFIPAPPIARSIGEVILLDYTLYSWHVLTHRIPPLWRLHQPYPVDREMDATTALRFHFGEISLSVLFRAAQVFALGPTLAGLTAWQSFLFVCILFHHANVRLPLHWERRLARVVITPRLHGIHHSVAPEEVNSNWSSGLTIWDWLHGTLRTDVPQEKIIIGVKGHRDDSDQELLNVLALPFRDVTAPVPPMPQHRPRQSITALQ